MATFADITEIEGVDLRQYARGSVQTPEMPLAFADAEIDAEPTDVQLGLVAVRGEEAVTECSLRLAFRLRVGDMLYLWSQDEETALAATVILRTHDRHLTLRLRFEPAGRSAFVAAEAAAFLRRASEATHIAIRLPNGRLSGDRLAIPEALRVDDGLLNLLDLLADVSRLARVDISVPKYLSDELLQDLLVARRLLRGQEVKGTWESGSMEMIPGPELDVLKSALVDRARNELLMVSDMELEILGVQVALGEVQQQFSDAEVVSIDDSGDKVVVQFRAHDGKASSVLRPLSCQIQPIEPHVVLPQHVIDEMLSDAHDGGEARLRELL